MKASIAAELKTKIRTYLVTIVEADETFKERLRIRDLDGCETRDWPRPAGMGDVGEEFAQLTHIPCVSWSRLTGESFIVTGFVG